MDELTKELSAAKGQRTQAWKDQRLGKVTASKCKLWMTQGRKKDELFGESCMTYLYGVIAEILTGSQHNIFGAALDWGEVEEEQAIARYKEVSGNKVRRIGFVPYLEDDLFGGSPDGLIEPDGMLEVKCPFNPANHIQTLLTKEIYNETHKFQIQANLLFSDRAWCDYVTYDPRIFNKENNIVIIRIERDKEIIGQIKPRIKLISEIVKEFIKKIK